LTLVVTELSFLACFTLSALSPAGREYILEARRVQEPPRIDGYLTDTCWKHARPAKNFTQYSPLEGVPSGERTYVYCVYDASAIYFAFICLDREPRAIDARLTPRESAQMGDCVAVFLDTFHDRQNAFMFQTNSRGVELDARVSEDGAEMDMAWDAIWRAEGRVTTRGWVVEIEIPYSSLRFPYSPSQIWGVQFWRYIQRLDETSYWVPVTRGEGFHVADFGELTGIKGIRHGLHLEALPYAALRGETRDSEDALVSADAGIDLKWGPAPDLTFDATLNPDFGQVEADPEYINLSRYEQYLVERRPFFVEGKELIDSLFFYSRRVGRRLADSTEVPILGGARLTGKAYGTSFAFTTAATEGASYEPPALYSAAGVRFDVLGSSNLGLNVAGKDTSGGYARCTGLDTHLRPDPRVELSGRFARSWNSNQSLEGYMGSASGAFRSADFSLGADYSDAGRDFYVEDFGYVPWYGAKYHHSWLKFHPRVNSMGLRSYGISLNHSMDKRYENPVWSRYTGPLFSASFTNLWQPWIGSYFGKMYEQGVEKPYFDIYGGLVTDYRKPLAATLVFKQYDLYNYSRQYFGHARTGYIELEVKPAGNALLSARFENVTEYREDWTLDQSSWIASQRMKISLRRDLHLRMYTLENTRAERYTVNGLIEWEFAPRSRVYIAFNEVRDNSNGDMRCAERIAFFKVSYLLNI
jgi:hypothetical protein